MDYYIQGNKERADQIKAAFEKLGIDASGYDFGNDNFLFFTYDLVGEGKVITTANVLHYFANIIKTHPDYQELELPKPHYDIANFQPFDHCRFKPTETHDWIYADFWYVQAHYKVEHLSAIEKWES